MQVCCMHSISGDMERVKIVFDVNGTEYDGGFEMHVADSYSRAQGRHWFIRFFY